MNAKWKDSSVRGHTRRKRVADCLSVKKTEVKCRDFSLWVAAGLKCSILCPRNESVTYQIVSTQRDQTKLPQLHQTQQWAMFLCQQGMFEGISMLWIWMVCGCIRLRYSEEMGCVVWINEDDTIWYRNHACLANQHYIRTFALTQTNLLSYMYLFDSGKYYFHWHLSFENPDDLFLLFLSYHANSRAKTFSLHHFLTLWNNLESVLFSLPSFS